MTNQSKKSDEEILFPSIKVGGITIEPWSFGVLFDLSPMLERLLDVVTEKGIAAEFEKGTLSYITMAKLFTLASKEVLEIMAITTNQEEGIIKKLSMADGVKIAMVIFQQNKETIKNALSPLLNLNPKGATKGK